MFGSKKEIEENLKKIEKEKHELLFIKEILENSLPKIDVTDLYVWEENGIYSIVKLEVKNIIAKDCFDILNNGFESTLIDIFTNKIVYKKTAIDKINRKQFIAGETLYEGHYAYLYPLYDADRNILAFVDKMVPQYVLQQLYYKLNNIDVNVYKLEKKN